ncbi:JPH2 protein, partial [Pitta sordida]|nr:JPH2 protein [Pitta sordida]
AGGGSPAPTEGDGRPASRGRGRPTEQMEIGPLQRIALEPDVELFKGYHSYAVRTSPVTPATDYEEEQFPEHESPSPEPRGDSQRRGGTPGLPQEREREQKVMAVVEAKPEPARPKEPQQRLSPERKAMARAEPLANRKTEARALGRTEPKAGAKRSPAAPVVAAVVAAQKAEECEEGPNTIVICMVILLNIGLAILFVHFLT